MSTLPRAILNPGKPHCFRTEVLVARQGGEKCLVFLKAQLQEKVEPLSFGRVPDDTVLMLRWKEVALLCAFLDREGTMTAAAYRKGGA